MFINSPKVPADCSVDVTRVGKYVALQYSETSFILVSKITAANYPNLNFKEQKRIFGFSEVLKQSRNVKNIITPAPRYRV